MERPSPRGQLKSQIHILKKEPHKRTERDLRYLCETFQENPFFQKLDSRTTDEVCKAMNLQFFAAGSYVFEEGDPGNEFFVILDGAVNVMVSVVSGDQDVASSPLATLGDSFKKQTAQADPQNDAVQSSSNFRPVEKPAEVLAGKDDDPAVLLGRRQRLKAKRVVKLLGLDTAVAEKGGWISAFKDDQVTSHRERRARGPFWSLKPRDGELTSPTARLVMLANEAQPHVSAGKIQAKTQEETTDLLSTQKAEDAVSEEENVENKQEQVDETKEGDLELLSNASHGSSEQEEDVEELHQQELPPQKNAKSLQATRLGAGSFKRPATMKRPVLQTVATLRCPASFGETALQADVPRTAAVKVEQDCWLAVLEAEDYKRILTCFVKKERAEKLDFAARSSLLCTLPPHVLPQMASLLREVEVAQHNVVCEIHQPIVDIFFIVKGQFSVSSHPSGGSPNRHSQDSGAKPMPWDGAKTVLMEGPEVFGLSAYLRGERTHGESLTCRSAGGGKLFAVAAKNLLALLSTEKKAALIGLAMTQQSFHDGRAAALLHLTPQLGPQPHAGTSPKKAGDGIYLPKGRLKALQAGLSGLASEASRTLSNSWSSPTLLNLNMPSGRKVKAEEKMPPMLPESAESSSRRLHPSLQHHWSESALAAARRMRRTQSMGVLHLIGPPLEVNSFFLRSTAQAEANEDMPISIAAVTVATSDPILKVSSSSNKQTKPRTSLLLPGDLSNEMLQLNQECAEMSKAASTIQARSRGRKSRIIVAEMRAEIKAATQIQAIVRGRRARQIMAAARLREVEEEEAAKRRLIREEEHVALKTQQHQHQKDETQWQTAKGNTFELQVDLNRPEEAQTRRQSANWLGAELDYDGENLSVLKQALPRNSHSRRESALTAKRSITKSLRRVTTTNARRSSMLSQRVSKAIMLKSGTQEDTQNRPVQLDNGNAETQRRFSVTSTLQLPAIHQAARMSKASENGLRSSGELPTGHRRIVRRLLPATEEDEQELVCGGLKEEAAEVEEELEQADVLSALTESEDDSVEEVEDLKVQEEEEGPLVEVSQQLLQKSEDVEVTTFFSTSITASPPSGKSKGFRRWLVKKQGISKHSEVQQIKKSQKHQKSDGISVDLNEIYRLLPAQR